MTDRKTLSASLTTDSPLYKDFQQYADGFDNKSEAVRSAIRDGIEDEQSRIELIREGLPAGIVLSFVLAVLVGVFAIVTAFTTGTAAAFSPAAISASGAILSIVLVELAKQLDARAAADDEVTA